MRTFESEPMHSEIPRASRRPTGAYPSPRSASVVGQRQTRAPASARRSSSRSSACVAWTTVVPGPRQPVSASSSIGRRPCSSRHSSISRGCSHAWTCSGSGVDRGVAGDLDEPVARARPNGVGRQPDTEPGGEQLLDILQVGRDRLLAKAIEAATPVRRVEHHELDAGGLCSLRRCVSLGQAEIVELSDRCVARCELLAIDALVRLADRLPASGAPPRPASCRARPRSRRRPRAPAEPAGSRASGR